MASLATAAVRLSKPGRFAPGHRGQRFLTRWRVIVFGLPVAGLILLAGCGTTHTVGPRPGAYSVAKFMSATGYGENEKSAIENAREELSRMISVHIQNEMKKIVMSGTGALAQNLRQVEIKTFTFSENDLIATRVAKTWYDADKVTYCSLAVLNRAIAGERYAAEIELEVEQSQLLHSSALRRQQEGKYVAALQNDFEGLSHIQRAVKMQLAGMVVCPRRGAEYRDMVDTPVLAKIKDHLRGLLQDVRIEKVSGDDQRTYHGYGLSQPLRVRVTGGGGKPVKDLPISFYFDEGKGALQGTTLTDSKGLAECHVEKVESAAKAASRIVARLDVTAMAGAVDMSRLPQPQAAFSCYLPTISNTHLALYIENETVANAVGQALTEAGFRLVPRSSVLALARKHGLKHDAGDTKLLKAFAEVRAGLGPKAFLLVVPGTTKVTAEVAADTKHGKLYIATVPYSLKLIDASAAGQKRTLRVVTGVGKDGYTGDEKEAIRRGYVDAGKEASKKLLEHLKKDWLE